MADFTNNTVTLEGRKLLMNSLVNGTGIEFTHFAIGDGAAPDAPENATELVNQLFTVNVSKTQPSDAEKGVTLVRGSFTNTSDQGNFYWRELGLYARTAGTEETPVLFGYTNTGEKADFIPAVGAGSVVVIGINLQIVTGNATVLYVSDPTARATMQDIEDMLAEVDTKLLEVDAKLDAFTEQHMATVGAQVAALQKSINDAITRLNDAGSGFVNNSGDTMTGDLKMTSGGKFIGNLTGNVTGNVEGNLTGDVTGNVKGDLTGSATQWQGWQLFSSLSEINSSLSDASTMLAIGQAMPGKSKLLHMTGTATVSATQFPASIGTLEIVKFNNTRCAYTFTAADGHRWHSAIHTNEPQWKGWVLSDGPPVGSMQMFAGSAAPFGYLLCQGQTVSKASYPALYGVIGYTYGGSGDNFKLPDFRGVFPRGFDAGRGVDANRKLGTQQASAAPNIKGTIKKAYYGYGEWGLTGAFGNAVREGWATRGGGGGDPSNISFDFDASRSSSVYNNSVKEVRPVNIAVNFIIKY